MDSLKPIDIVTCLKLGLSERGFRYIEKNRDYESESFSSSVADLSESLSKGKADISRSINRSVRLGLLAEREPRALDAYASNRKYYSVNRNALSDLLCYGIRWVFGGKVLGVGRGVPTGWNCPSIRSAMNPPEIPLVWSAPSGEVRGELIEPLFDKSIFIAKEDPDLYELLALIDVIRVGKARELNYAKEILQEKVMDLYA